MSGRSWATPRCSPANDPKVPSSPGPAPLLGHLFVRDHWYSSSLPALPTSRLRRPRYDPVGPTRTPGGAPHLSRSRVLSLPETHFVSNSRLPYPRATGVGTETVLPGRFKRWDLYLGFSGVFSGCLYYSHGLRPLPVPSTGSSPLSPGGRERRTPVLRTSGVISTGRDLTPFRHGPGRPQGLPPLLVSVGGLLPGPSRPSPVPPHPSRFLGKVGTAPTR